MNRIEKLEQDIAEANRIIEEAETVRSNKVLETSENFSGSGVTAGFTNKEMRLKKCGITFWFSKKSALKLAAKITEMYGADDDV